MIREDVKVQLSRGTKVIIQVAAVAGAITAIAGAYTFYLNYLWKPEVEVTKADFEKGQATLRVRSLIGKKWKTIEIDGETTYQLGGDWGIRFGTIMTEEGSKYNRIELVRKGMVYEYLNKQ